MNEMSNGALLCLLLGEDEAAALSDRPLSVAFGLRDRRQAQCLGEPWAEYGAHPKLAAARELVRRLLLEKMHEGLRLDSPQAVKDFLVLHLANRDHECFMALFLDTQNRLIAAREMFRGTLDQTAVYPREIVKEALAHNAAAVIFAHNHPSGTPEPSRSDEVLTRTLIQALELFDIRVLDHIVVGGPGAVVSFAERGLL